MNTTQLLYLPAFSGLFGWRGMLDVSLTREARIKSYCLMHRADCGFLVLPIYLKKGIPFDIVTFNTLIRGIFTENKVKDVVELFKKLVRENICEPNQVTYATVMNGLSKRGYTQKTLSLLRLMEQGNTNPNIINYNIVIDSLCKDGNLDAAINLMNEMKQNGILPNIVTYNSLIDGLSKLGQWEKVKTMFYEMVLNLNIYLNVCTFNIVIDGLCKEGKVADAEDVMGHMVEKGVEPDIFTYNAMMDGYCLCGQLDGARRIFDIMIDKNIEPDNISYSILINGYCMKKKVDECNCFMKFVKTDQSLILLPTVLSCKYGLVEEAMSLFIKLERKREGTIAFYNAVINGLCKNGKLDEAHVVFEKLSFIGLLPNVRTYTVMINGFCLKGLFDEAKDILRKWKTKVAFQTMSHTILLSKYFSGATKLVKWHFS
ncbi:putative pentatricopeptide repeat-containing protein At1g12700, mitochondrial [Solanum dulcamara]|uniref:putative pentatricopeptide repeat-containing protein At1g12700, mitochondrial n=1 Tax=Solanum dulcamara TaxID=45834 RepID=UPI0024862B8B|nr:putative pentatricopeptide repeat-containing protein At1g12700, mitochondrial [Solanum dulcamara]